MTCRKVLGDWGEAHARGLLKAAKFTNIVPLNVGRQHPGGDVMATKDGRTYFFSVKARDRFGQDGKPNPGYNIYPEKVIKAAQIYGATPAWLVIRADRRSNTFCAYWGLIAEIPAGRAGRNQVYVKMGEDDIAQYRRLGRCLASDVSDPTIANVFYGKAAVMPASGIITTKEDVQAFANSCVLLRAQWEHFQILFEGAELKHELLQTTAPIFFGDLNRLFIEHLILHICRLTDNAQTSGRKNLTVRFLIKHSDFSAAPDTLRRLNRASANIDAFRNKILPARDRLISHLDLEAVRLDQSLGAASDAEWKQFWLDLQDFLELMFRHHVDPNGHFYLNSVDNISDADSLLTALVNAKRFLAVLDDEKIATQAIYTSDKSKFAGDL